MQPDPKQVLERIDHALSRAPGDERVLPELLTALVQSQLVIANGQEQIAEELRKIQRDLGAITGEVESVANELHGMQASP